MEMTPANRKTIMKILRTMTVKKIRTKFKTKQAIKERSMKNE